MGTIHRRSLLSYKQVTLNFKLVNKTQSETILSCSVGASLNESEQVVYEWNEDGPVYGPNGQLELDPDNQQCAYYRAVFANCKNNCPGGEPI